MSAAKVVAKSSGHVVVERIAGWLSGYMYFPDPRVAMVLALWAVHTWVFKRFDATPYLCVTAATKQAGKTRLMELLRMITRNGRMFGDMTPAALFRMLGAYDGEVTTFYDEAERLSGGAAGVMRSLMNTGYRVGQMITRAKAGGGVDEFPVFAPKCFALIGDVNDTLRDRSIVITLQRGKPEREFFYSEAEGEARELVNAIAHLFVGGWPTAGHPDFLNGRDREIWSALFGVAEACGLDREAMESLTACAADLTAAKTAPARKFTKLEGDEDEAVAASYGERAVRDLWSVFKADEKWILTNEVVARLRAIPSGPWRTFKGTGIDEFSLSSLVRPFGIRPRQIKVAAGKNRRGYVRADVQASQPAA
jgi:hypothetical protein